MAHPGTQRNAEHITKVIFDYAARIGRERDSEKLLVLISDLARDLVGADRCSIWLLDPDTSELWTKVAHGQSEIRIPAGQGLVGACIKDRAPVLVNDTSSDGRFLGRVDEKTGYVTKSVLAVPLRSHGDEPIGAFQALNKPGGFDAQDIDLLELAGSYSASAIEEQRLRGQAEQARILLKELEIAREVQQQLFPRVLPQLRGYDYASQCRPAKFVGGDYYDFFRLPDGNVALTVGDVAGKGIAAAIMMASIQSSLRGLLLRGEASLAKLMDEFNQTVYESSTYNRYTTLFCAVVEPEARRLTYVNAGQQNPLLLRDADGREPVIDKLCAGGVPIGLVPGMRYEQESLILRPGDVLVSYSDGISEVVNPQGQMWDDEALQILLWENRRRTARQLIDFILEVADRYASGADQHDDMTATILKVG